MELQRNRQLWEKHEDEYIKQFYTQGVSCEEIGEALGRSPRAVEGRAWRLGLYIRKTVNKPTISLAKAQQGEKPVESYQIMDQIQSALPLIISNALSSISFELPNGYIFSMSCKKPEVKP